MNKIEYLILYPTVSALLSAIGIVILCVLARRIYWKNKTKNKNTKLGKALNRYLSKYSDEYLDTNNVPEWFKKYKKIKFPEKIEIEPIKPIYWQQSTDSIGKIIAKTISPMGVAYEVELDMADRTPDEIEELKKKIQRAGFLDE